MNKPLIVTELDSAATEALVIGENPLASQLREILDYNGIKIDSSKNPGYIFQLGNFEKTEGLLRQAAAFGAKFFLILDRDRDVALSKKAEEETLKLIRTKKNFKAKIIKLSGFTNHEIEAARKILEISFKSSEESINLNGPGAFWEKKEGKQPATKRKFVSWGVRLASSIFLLTLPIIFILSHPFLGTLHLGKARNAIFSSALDKGKKEAVLASSHFSTAREALSTLAPLFRFLGMSEQTKKIEGWFEIGYDLGEAVKYLAEAGLEGQELILISLGKKEGEAKEIISKIFAGVSQAEEKLGLLEIKTDKPPFLGEKFGQISSLRKELAKIKKFFPVASWALGLEKKRFFLVLFQNNMELRPGGGFIGTLGFLTFDEGKLDLKIEDVYTADGQLRGHVEPPKPIRKHLNQPHWYLRDSNWEPDFPTNGKRAAWFLEKELGLKPDGVIALDLTFVKKILDVIGPVEIPDYKEKITSENLFLKAQIYSQENFFPGSTQKRDFLASLAWALIDKLAAQKSLPWLKIGRAVEEAASQKHLFIFFEEPLPQKLISEQGFGGEIREVACSGKIGPDVKCLADYLMIVEANLGVNKVNYFVKREIKKELKVENDWMDSKITIVYENTSPPNVSFGGNYKNYLRILTTNNFALEKVKTDGRELDQEGEVDRTTTFGKTEIGFLVEIPYQSKKIIEIFYKMPLGLPENEFVYQLLVQKQPGTSEEDPFILQVSAPWQTLETNFSYQLVAATDQVAKNEIISYNGNLSVDRIFRIRFKK